jgi:hypothetical protein
MGSSQRVLPFEGLATMHYWAFFGWMWPLALPRRDIEQE